MSDETNNPETPIEQEPAAATPEGDATPAEPTEPAEGDAGASDAS